MTDLDLADLENRGPRRPGSGWTATGLPGGFEEWGGACWSSSESDQGIRRAGDCGARESGVTGQVLRRRQEIARRRAPARLGTRTTSARAPASERRLRTQAGSAEGRRAGPGRTTAHPRAAVIAPAPAVGASAPRAGVGKAGSAASSPQPRARLAAQGAMLQVRAPHRRGRRVGLGRTGGLRKLHTRAGTRADLERCASRRVHRARDGRCQRETQHRETARRGGKPAIDA